MYLVDVFKERQVEFLRVGISHLQDFLYFTDHFSGHVYGRSNSSNSNDLQCPGRSFPFASFSSAIFHICGASRGLWASAELLVIKLHVQCVNISYVCVQLVKARTKMTWKWST